MDAKLQKIINLYKKDLQKFIEKNALNADYYADIEERINEKISLLENPTRDDIKNILSEIGSPEEIFREELESRVIEKVAIKKKWYQKFLASDHVIFLGVFKELSEKTSISAGIYRLTYLFLFFIGIVTKANILIPVLIVSYILGFLILRTGIFRFLFSLGISFLLLVFLGLCSIIFGLYLADFSFGNMFVFMNMSILLPVGLVIGIFSLVVLLVFFVHYAFTGKTLGLKFFMTGFTTFVIAGICGAAFVFNMTNRYMPYTETTIAVSSDIDAEKNNLDEPITFRNWDFVNTFQSNKDSRSEKLSPQFSWYQQINFFPLNPLNSSYASSFYYIGQFEPSDDDKIHIEVTKRTFGNAEIQEFSQKFFTDFSLKIENNRVQFVAITNPEGKYPLMFGNFSANKVRVPLNVRFQVWGMPGITDLINFDNYEKASELDEYMRYSIASQCTNLYFGDDKKLHCEAQEVEEIRHMIHTAESSENMQINH